MSNEITETELVDTEATVADQPRPEGTEGDGGDTGTDTPSDV